MGGANDTSEVWSDLLAAWRRQVAACVTTTVFVLEAARELVLEGGRSVVLAAGEQVSIGLELAPGGGPRFVVKRVSSGEVFLPASSVKDLGDGFRLELHTHRGLRPGADRVSTPGPYTGSTGPVPAAGCAFRCEDRAAVGSLLAKEPLAVLPRTGGLWACFANASVFDPTFHALWVPAEVRGDSVALPHVPQQLTAELLADLLALHQSYAHNALTFFQTIAAGGTVNHLHAQCVSRPWPLPIEFARVRRAGGYNLLDGYPARGLVFNTRSGCGSLWRAVARVQRRGVPYNLVLIKNEAFLIVRNPDHIVVREWAHGIAASMEICGRAITHSRAVYAAVGRPELAAALRATTLGDDAILTLLSDP